MPGRSGRSKGCVNCRRRKRGCDQAKPSCGRCTRLGERCEGYSDASFIAFEPPSGHPSASGHEGHNLIESEPGVADRVSIIKLPISLNIGPMQDEVFINYTVNTHTKRKGNHYAVLSIMNPSDPSNMLYKSSITALGTTFFGMFHGRTDLILKGSQLYGKCLNQVNLALTWKQDCLTADLISCIVCLGIFEFIHPTSNGGWTHHFRGLSRIFEKLGPAACLEMPIRDIFRNCRPSLIFNSMDSCKPSFLAQEEWKTIPWQGNGIVKSPLELLFDIMTDLSTYTYTQAKISSVKEASHVKMDAILDHVSKLKLSIGYLDQWMIEFDLQHSNYREECPYASLVGSSEGQPIKWTSFYRYSSLPIANSICFYYATNIYLMLLLLVSTLGRPHVDEVAIITELEDLAVKICKSVEYHLSHLHGAVDGLFLLYPLKMAMRAFVKLGMKPEIRWIRDQFENISKRKSELRNHGLTPSNHPNLAYTIYKLHASRQYRITEEDRILRVVPEFQ